MDLGQADEDEDSTVIEMVELVTTSDRQVKLLIYYYFFDETHHKQFALRKHPVLLRDNGNLVKTSFNGESRSGYQGIEQ